MRRKIFFTIIILIFVVTSAILYINKIFFPLQFKQIVTNKLHQELNREITIDAIQFDPTKGFVIQNLKILGKDTPETVLYAKRVSFNILYLPIIKSRKIIIHSISIKNPFIRIIRQKENLWNFSDLIPSQQDTHRTKNPFTFFIGDVLINNATVSYLDKSLSSGEFSEDFENLNVKVNISPPKSVKFHLEANAIKHSSNILVKGQYQLLSKEISANLKIQNIPLAKYLNLYYRNKHFHLHKGIISKGDLILKHTNQKTDLRGSFEISDTDLTINPDKIIQGHIAVNDASLSFKNKTINLKGALDISKAVIKWAANEELNGDIKINELTFKHNDKKTEIEGDLKIQDSKIKIGTEQEFQGTISTPNIYFVSSTQNTDIKGDITIEDAKIKIGEHQEMRGNITTTDTSLNLVDQKVAIKGDLTIENAYIKTGSEQEFSGNITTTDTSLNLVDQKVAIKGDLTIENAYIKTGHEQEFSGMIKTTDTTFASDSGEISVQTALKIDGADFKISPESSLQGGITSSNFELISQGEKINIDSSLKISNAKIKLSDHQEILCDPDIKIRLQHTPDSIPKFTCDGSVKVSKAQFLGVPYVDSLKNISGTIHFSHNNASSDLLKFNTLAAPIEVSGSVTNFTKPILDIQAFTEEITLEKIGKLFPELLKKANLKSVNGQSAITLNYKGDLSSPQDAQIDITALLKETDFTGEKFPITITNVSGEIVYSSDQLLTWGDLQATLEDQSYTFNGTFKDFSHPKIETNISSDFINLSAKINLSDDSLKIDTLKGKYFTSSFDFKGELPLPNNQDPFVNLSGKIDLALNDLNKIPLSLREKINPYLPTGKVQFQGHFKGQLKDYRHWDFALNAQSPQFSLWGYSLTDINLDIKQEDRDTSLCNLSGLLYDGKLDLSLSVNLTKDEIPYRLTANLKKANLKKFITDTSMKEKALSGYLSLFAVMNGSLKDLSTTKGNGDISIIEGDIMKLKLFKGLWEVLGVLVIPEFRNAVFTSSSLHFIIRNQRISTDNFFATSKVMSLKGKGWINFKKNISFDVIPELKEKPIDESDSFYFQKAASKILTQADQYVKVHVSGPLDDPNYAVIPIPIRVLEKTKDLLLEGLKSIF